MPDRKQLKTCFVIAPIGEEGSETRRRSDQVLNHIVAPATEECGYKAIRADKLSEPGLITSQIIQHLLDAPLVVADLTGRNPNVFYELAVRHVVGKPYVQIIQMKEPIPFDVAQTRIIQFDYRDLDSVANCRENLVNQIRSVEKNPLDVDTPISMAVDLKFLRQSKNPLERSNAKVVSMLAKQHTLMEELNEKWVQQPRIPGRVIHDLLDALYGLNAKLSLKENEEPTRERFDEAREFLLDMHYAYSLILGIIMPEHFFESDSFQRILKEVSEGWGDSQS